MKDEADKQERFHGLSDGYFWFASQNAIVRRAVQRLVEARSAQAGNAPLRIVDVGCGPGNTLLRLRDLGRVFGIDYSTDALRFAKDRGLSAVRASLDALPTMSESADVIVALDVLEHVEDDREVLRQIHRTLKPGGVFVFTVPAFMSLWRQHDVEYGHFRRYDRREFVAKVADADLRIRQCHFFKCAFFPLVWMIAAGERANLLTRRDNFRVPPRWLNYLMHKEIEWEAATVASMLPFGVSLICTGER